MEKLTFHNGSTTVPPGIADKLPIFKFLGDSLPEGMKTPEAKRTISKTFYFLCLAAGTIFFFKNYDKLLDFAEKGILFVLYGIALVVLIGLTPLITRFLSNLGRLVIKRADNMVKDEFAIEFLETSLDEMNEGLVIAGKRITEVEAVKDDTEASAAEEMNNYNEQIQYFENAMTDARKWEEKEKIAREKSRQNPDDSDLEAAADECLRKVNEATSSASSFQSKALSSKKLSEQFAQHANQFGKAVNILKNNESWAKQGVEILESSISILKKEYTAAVRLNKASEGIADIFASQNRQDVKVAINAVKFKITSQITAFKRNLELVDQSKLKYTHQSQTREQLEAFSLQLKNGGLQPLQIGKIMNPEHQLKDSEIINKRIMFKS